MVLSLVSMIACTVVEVRATKFGNTRNTLDNTINNVFSIGEAIDKPLAAIDTYINETLAPSTENLFSKFLKLEYEPDELKTDM